jgi:hypothetical protein
MTINEFFNQDIKNGYVTVDYFKLSKLNIPTPEFLKSEKEKNFSLLLNFGKGIHGALHYDNANNSLLQLRGSKKIILFPPSERPKVHLANSLNTRFLCSLNKFLSGNRRT